jgi:hypothetical protein
VYGVGPDEEEEVEAKRVFRKLCNKVSNLSL